jgi:hypothetical protein
MFLFVFFYYLQSYSSCPFVQNRLPVTISQLQEPILFCQLQHFSMFLQVSFLFKPLSSFPNVNYEFDPIIIPLFLFLHLQSRFYISVAH